MLTYLIRRLLLVVPTLLGVMLINFIIIESAPGGPIDQILSQTFGAHNAALTRLQSGGEDAGSQAGGGQTSSGQLGSGGNANVSETATRLGLSEYQVEIIRERFGFDKPWYERLGAMLARYATFDFGEATFRDELVLNIILEKMPVSISLGIWTTLLTYLISIPLGIRKALYDGTSFDLATSFVIIVGYALPSFLVAILLLTLFAGGQFWNIFPNRGLVSVNFDELTALQKVLDYFWHLALPLVSMMLGAFATLTLLTKNSFLDQIRQQYVLTARAKGLSNTRILYGHVFRNAMILIISGFPAALIGILFSSSLLIEVIFGLDGLGKLGYEAVIKRDYGIIFSTLYFFTLFGLLMGIFSDFMLTVVDPRIDFESREV